MIFEVECDKRNEITDRTDAMFIGNISTDVSFNFFFEKNLRMVVAESVMKVRVFPNTTQVVVLEAVCLMLLLCLHKSGPNLCSILQTVAGAASLYFAFYCRTFNVEALT